MRRRFGTTLPVLGLAAALMACDAGDEVEPYEDDLDGDDVGLVDEVDPAYTAAGLTADPRPGQRPGEEPRRAPQAAGALTLSGPDGEPVLLVDRQLPPQVRVGEEYTYRVTMRNAADHPVHDVVVRETMGSGVEIMDASLAGRGKPVEASAPKPQKGSQGQSGSQQQQGSRKAGSEGSQQESSQQQGSKQQGSSSPGAFRFDVGTIEAGATRTLEVRAVAHEEGETKACLVVDYRPSLCETIEVVEPELRLTRRMEERELFACEEVAVMYRITNTGSGTTEAVRLREQLPEGLVTADGRSEVSMDIGRLEPGDSREEVVRLTGETAGTYELRAVAETEGGLKVTTAKTEVRVLRPELELTLDGPEEAYVDRPVEYTLTVRNPSDDPAPDTVVAIDAPEGRRGIRFASQVPREGDALVIGRLDAGAERTVRFRIEPDDPQTLTVRARAEAYCAEAVTKEVSTEVVGIAAVLIEVIDQVDPVPNGEATTYLVSVKNQGSAEDMNVSLEGELPELMEFVSGEGDSVVTAKGRTVRFGPIESLAPGDVVSWRVVARATGTGDARFRVQMTSDANPKPVQEEEPTTIY